jgi:TPR repeat protein
MVALGQCTTCNKVAQLKKCMACQLVGYCCRECQTADWSGGHKQKCKLLQKARKEAVAAAALKQDKLALGLALGSVGPPPRGPLMQVDSTLRSAGPLHLKPQGRQRVSPPPPGTAAERAALDEGCRLMQSLEQRAGGCHNWSQQLSAADQATVAKVVALWGVAGAGVAGAHRNLGILFTNGHGVGVDLAKACAHWRQGAEMGDQTAQVDVVV